MQKFFKKYAFISAAGLGFILLIPLIALEFVNRWRFDESFPFSLFTFAWILQSLFIMILIPLIKDMRSGKSLIKKPLRLLLHVLGLLLIAYIWVGWLVDQWPCLMGVLNCD